MARAEIKIKLETLLGLLQQEREMATALDMTGLQEVVAAKDELLSELRPQPEEVDGLEDLLKKIDHENRRNADGGQSRTLSQGGRLLSGKV